MVRPKQATWAIHRRIEQHLLSDTYASQHVEPPPHWQVDVDYLRQVDSECRRLKTDILKRFVLMARERIRQQRQQQQQQQQSQMNGSSRAVVDQDSATENDSDERDPLSADVEWMEVTDSGHFNRLLSRSYSRVQQSTVGLKRPSSSLPEAATASTSSSSASTSASLKVNQEMNAGGVQKKQRAVPKEYAPPSVRYADLGGIGSCIDEVRELIQAPMAHPEIYLHLNIAPPRGVLLHGPPGCGKTMLARAVAGELGVPFIQISAPSIVSGMSGESEKKIRDVFTEAKSLAPCILFLDEIDAITPKRETAQREMERRIVAQLLTCMDDLCLANTNNQPVIVMGATNRPDALDAALRRSGRFDREIAMGMPDESARENILRVLTAKLRLTGNFDFLDLAKNTPGYVGADLAALTTVAGISAVKRIFSYPLAATSDQPMDVLDSSGISIEGMSTVQRFLESHPDPFTDEELTPLAITMDDFRAALKQIQPSSKREGFASVPDVTWSDIGALASIRDELRMSIVEPIRRPNWFARVGIMRPSGVLLWGPPGCGKTLLAKAIANESHCNFISIKGPELLNKYVGESERAVRQVFARARASAPCVIFFDELDALCPRRGDGSDSQTSERVVNQLLTELDGMESRKSVFIIAATNRPDIIDRAMLRPGRFDKLLHVQLPTAQERRDILKTLCKNIPLDEGVDLGEIAASDQCHRFSGADLSALVREAGLAALRESLPDEEATASDGDESLGTRPPLRIRHHHFVIAFTKVTPSVTEQDLKSYRSQERRLVS